MHFWLLQTATLLTIMIAQAFLAATECNAADSDNQKGTSGWHVVRH